MRFAASSRSLRPSDSIVEPREELTSRVHAIKRERFKWAEKAMAGAVPDDIAAEKSGAQSTSKTLCASWKCMT